MRRFKITVHKGDDPWGSPRWDVIDTFTEEHFGPFETSELAREDATKREKNDERRATRG